MLLVVHEDCPVVVDLHLLRDDTVVVGREVPPRVPPRAMAVAPLFVPATPEVPHVGMVAYSTAAWRQTRQSPRPARDRLRVADRHGAAVARTAKGMPAAAVGLRATLNGGRRDRACAPEPKPGDV